MADDNSAFYEKLARMDNAGVAHVDIANALEVSEGHISRIFATPEYKAALATVQMESFDKIDVLNRGWDSVEDLGVARVIEVLQTPFVDEDFAMKAAIYANKALRRGKGLNNPLQVPSDQQTVVTLHATFVNQLQESFVVEPRKVEDLVKKDTNILNVAGVKKLLNIKSGKTVVAASDADIVDVALAELHDA